MNGIFLTSDLVHSVQTQSPMSQRKVYETLADLTKYSLIHGQEFLPDPFTLHTRLKNAWKSFTNVSRANGISSQQRQSSKVADSEDK